MSTVVTIEEAQAKLTELIAHLCPGDELVITQNERPVAQLRPLEDVQPSARFGRGKGLLLLDIDDDSHLDDFREYME